MLVFQSHSLFRSRWGWGNSRFMLLAAIFSIASVWVAGAVDICRLFTFVSFEQYHRWFCSFAFRSTRGFYPTLKSCICVKMFHARAHGFESVWWVSFTYVHRFLLFCIGEHWGIRVWERSELWTWFTQVSIFHLNFIFFFPFCHCFVNKTVV